jgi:fluoride exporter
VSPGRSRLLLAASVGGAVGALLRYLLGELAPDGSGFPWTTFGINVVGSLLLALLPALAAVRRHRVVAVALGPGVLGGFTTLSAYAEQGRALVADGETLLAGSYLLGTLLACLVAVRLASRLSTSE